MRRAPESDSWSRYLEAERSGRDEEAEVALLALFTALPQLAPPAGFSARVLARLGPLAAVASLTPLGRRSLFAHRAVRWAVAATLLVAGLGFALLAPMLPPLAALVGPGKLLGGIFTLVSDLAVRFASGVAFWEQIGALGATLARAASNPTVAALLLFNLILAAAALRGLAALASGFSAGVSSTQFSKEGSPRHVVS